MTWLCKHQWNVRAQTVARPKASTSFDGTGAGVLEAMERMTHGFTKVLLTCSRCGKIETRTLLGVNADDQPKAGSRDAY